jgi:predicted DCC family thiol-disulfide oxidoreductase YuxK
MSTITPSMAEKQAKLPTIDDLPEADVVIYDGHCSFCTNGVTRLARWDGGGRLAFVSLHDPIVAERYPDLSYDDMMRQMYVVDRFGDRHGGASAIRYLTRRLPRLWPVVPFTHFPFCMPLWQWGYMQVAKRRYRLNRPDDACENGACAVHFGEKEAKK